MNISKLKQYHDKYEELLKIEDILKAIKALRKKGKKPLMFVFMDTDAENTIDIFANKDVLNMLSYAEQYFLNKHREMLKSIKE